MRRTRRFLSLSLIVAFLMGLLITPGTAQAASEEALLTDLNAVVRQNGDLVPQGGELSADQPVRVDVSFQIPVAGDDPVPSNPVVQGDTARIELSDSFRLLAEETIPLKMGDILVGHARIDTDENGMVYALVTFDGDPEVFDGTYNTVTARFGLDLEYDKSGDAGAEGSHDVRILDKTYKVVVLPQAVEYNVVKSGAVNLSDQSVEWTIKLTADQGGRPVDISGHTLTEFLSSVGSYLPDSFQVNGQAAVPQWDEDKLTYLFPVGSTSPITVTLRTRIPDAAWTSSREQTLLNKVQLSDALEEIVGKGEAQVRFTPKWIEKSGKASDGPVNGIYDPTNRTITWSIVANHLEASLRNVVIQDSLPAGLTFDSAYWQAFENGEWGAEQPIVPEGSAYSIGSIDSRIRLTIVTKVPDEDYSVSAKQYRNQAKIFWEDGPASGIASNQAGVTVGFNAIAKSGKVNPASQRIDWTVAVDLKGQQVPNVAVYDLLVYGPSAQGFTPAGTVGLPAGLAAGQLVPRYDQRYVEGSFAGEGLTLTVHPITRDGVRIADLLEVRGFVQNQSRSFHFQSQVLNPDIVVGNRTSQVWNTAQLWSGQNLVNASTSQVQYPSRMLAKELLRREAFADPDAQIDSHITTDASLGFHYQEQAVLFRLSVNADALMVSGIERETGESLGAVTLTDVLPEGWVFRELSPGEYYRIYQGAPSSGSSVKTIGEGPIQVDGLVADISGDKASFRFESLDKPYVILVKAGPKDELAQEYFQDNGSVTVQNQLKLISERWEPGISVQQNVTINSQVLEKTLEITKAGELSWQVDYQPYDLQHSGAKIVDTIPGGLELRTDSSGQLILTGSVSIKKMILQADGSYVEGDELPLQREEPLTYDPSTRELTFVLPDSSQAYRLTYTTDVTGEPGAVTN
ncbi:MAG: hypothetical protein QMB61_01835, partial [Clostridiaceae bacterium]